MTEGTFDWPCDRRDAHEPNSDTCTLASARVIGGILIQCPGVAAHPSTQIGGNYVSERPPSRETVEFATSIKCNPVELE